MVFYHYISSISTSTQHPRTTAVDWINCDTISSNQGFYLCSQCWLVRSQTSLGFRDMALSLAAPSLRRSGAIDSIRGYVKLESLLDDAIEDLSSQGSSASPDTSEAASWKLSLLDTTTSAPTPEDVARSEFDISPLRPTPRRNPLGCHANVNIIGNIEGFYFAGEPASASDSSPRSPATATTTFPTIGIDSAEASIPRPGCCSILRIFRLPLRGKHQIRKFVKICLSRVAPAKHSSIPAHRILPTSPSFYHWNEVELRAIHVASLNDLNVWNFVAWFYARYDVQCRVNGTSRRMPFPREKLRSSAAAEIELASQVADLLKTGRVWVEGDWEGAIVRSVGDVLERWLESRRG